MKMKTRPNKQSGSALVWSVAVIAILMITVLATVSVALAYASSAAKRSMKNQVYYTAMSGLDIVIDWLCDGVKYVDGFDQHPVIDSMAIGSEYEYTLDLTTPASDGISIMGSCTAVVRRVDDKTVLVTVTAEIPETVTRSVSAVLQKKTEALPGAGSGIYIDGNQLSMDANSILCAMKDTSIVCNANCKFNGNKNTLPTITAEENGMLYFEKIGNDLRNKKVIIPEVVQTTSLITESRKLTLQTSVPAQNEVQWVSMFSLSDFNPSKYYYRIASSIAHDSALRLQPENGADYLFVTDQNNRDFPIDIRLNNPGDTANIYIIADRGLDIEIYELPETVNLFIVSEPTSVVFNESTAIHGFISCKNISIAGGTRVDVYSAAPEKYIDITYPEGMSSSGGFSHEWIFSKYKSADIAD